MIDLLVALVPARIKRKIIEDERREIANSIFNTAKRFRMYRKTSYLLESLSEQIEITGRVHATELHHEFELDK